MRPYEFDDTVDVIGHDDEFVQYDIGTDMFCFAPFFIRDDPRFIELNLIINNSPNNGTRLCVQTVIKYKPACE